MSKFNFLTVYSCLILIVYVITLFILFFTRIKSEDIDKPIFNKNKDIHEEIFIESKNKTKLEFVSKKYTIPILVIACNRPEALQNHLSQLLKFQPNPFQFPIHVSIDCFSTETLNVAKQFSNSINYIYHPFKNQENSNYSPYENIARHYKKAFNYIFNVSATFDSVIITEDDLNISPDFYNYFNATRPLLDKDSSIWCVSAWNDNGIRNLIDLTADKLLYRTDSMLGLGWMIKRDLWVDELNSKWPTIYWDDWMREAENRKGRQCVRPEIPRTSMSEFGQIGASNGQFFNSFLSKIQMLEKSTNYSDIDFSYLLKENYEKMFKKKVYQDSVLINDWNIANSKNARKQFCSNGIRVPYENYEQFVNSNRLEIMSDTRAGIPRTSYDNIVTFFKSKCRFYLVPKNHPPVPSSSL